MHTGINISIAYSVKQNNCNILFMFEYEFTFQSEKSNLSRFEGSNSISSAELFGREEMTGVNSTYQPPDLDDVKESVKQGVTKVAGKLSSLANGMMSSFQVN